jgi:predicted CopG family antitoxin
MPIPDEILRKNIQVSLDVWETLTDLKRGNDTYTDVIIRILEKAKIPLVIK